MAGKPDEEPTRLRCPSPLVGPHRRRNGATLSLRCLLTLVVLQSLVGCRGTEEPAAKLPGPAQSPVTEAGTELDRYLSAVAAQPTIEVFDQPDAASPRLRLSHPNPEGAPLVFAVMDGEIRGGHQGWLRVALPVEPNGSSGWIRGDDVVLSRHSFRVEIRLAQRELRVFDGDTVIQLEPIGLGRTPTATPGGPFYVYELLAPTDPEGPHGPYAFGLSGFSEATATTRGEAARLFIHGTKDPRALGTDTTSGCIRLTNDAIQQLAHSIPLGTPVTLLG